MPLPGFPRAVLLSVPEAVLLNPTPKHASFLEFLPLEPGGWALKDPPNSRTFTVAPRRALCRPDPQAACPLAPPGLDVPRRCPPLWSSALTPALAFLTAQATPETWVPKESPVLELGEVPGGGQGRKGHGDLIPARGH